MMMKHPLVYEINTRCWLHELSGQQRAPITLGNVPEAEFARWRQLGFTHVWLMGVWRTGSRSRELSRQLSYLRETYGELLPNFSEVDISSSHYAIAGDEVAENMAVEAGLHEFHESLNSV